MPSFVSETGWALSIDSLLVRFRCRHPCVTLRLLLFFGFFVFGLGALETSTLLPVPLYGCWNAITSAQLSGKLACSNIDVFSKKIHTEEGFWSCGNYGWWQPQLWGGSLLVVGRFIICLATGIGADVFGRRRSTIVWMGTYFVFAFARSFAPLVEVYVVCITMEAISAQATSIALLLIACEGSTQKESVRSGCVVLLGHALGVGIGLPLTVSLINMATFRQVARSLPSLMFVLYICFLPESIRWLITQGRLEDINPAFRKMYRVSLNDSASIHVSSVYQETDRSLKLCKSRGGIMRRTLFPLVLSRSFARIFYPFMLLGFLIGSSIGFRLIYDPLPYNSIEDRVLICGVSELVALLVTGLMIGRLPARRVLVALSILLAVVIMLTRILKHAYYESCAGELFFSSFGHFVAILVWVWLVFSVIRLTPTHSRGTMMGFTIGFATVGHALSEIIYKKAKVSFGLNDLFVATLFGGFCLLSASLALILHSTPKVMPDSIFHIETDSYSDSCEDSSTQEDEPLQNEPNDAENTKL